MPTTAQRQKRKTKRREEDLADLPPFAARVPGSLYRISQGVGFDVIQEKVAVDSSSMSASAVINTAVIDRQSEIIVPTGGDYTDYELNPTVLWEHGWGGINTPIAQSEHPNGELAIDEFDDRIEATSYFTEREKTSEQIFVLVDEGIVRATSIHVSPLNRRVERIDGCEVGIYDLWKMVEWSWGMLGVNPEAVRKTLSRNRLADRAIDERILRSLRPWAATAKAQVQGHDFPKPTTNEDDDMSADQQDTHETKLADALKAKSADDSLDFDRLTTAAKAVRTLHKELSIAKTIELAAKMLDADEPSKNEPPTDAPNPDAPDDEPVDTEETTESDLPPSAQVLSAVHTSLADLCANLDAAKNRYENPDVRAFLDELVGELDGKKQAVSDLFASVTDGQTLKMDDAEEAAKSAREREIVKGWLAGGAGRSTMLGGVGKRLKTLAGAKNITPEQRKTLVAANASLERMVNEAKEFSEQSENSELADLTKSIEAMTKKVNQVVPGAIAN